MAICRIVSEAVEIEASPEQRILMMVIQKIMIEAAIEPCLIL